MMVSMKPMKTKLTVPQLHSWQIDLPERKNWKKKTEKEIEIEGGDSAKETYTTLHPKVGSKNQLCERKDCNCPFIMCLPLTFGK